MARAPSNDRFHFGGCSTRTERVVQDGSSKTGSEAEKRNAEHEKKGASFHGPGGYGSECKRCEPVPFQLASVLLGLCPENARKRRILGTVSFGPPKVRTSPRRSHRCCWRRGPLALPPSPFALSLQCGCNRNASSGSIPMK